MELIYIWIKKFRTFENQEINLSDKFNVKYECENSKIIIKRNENYKSLYPEHITSVNAIVGKNGAGKTNVIDLIGLRKKDRNKFNAEFSVIMKYDNPTWEKLRVGKVDEIVQHYSYFQIYYLGRDKNGKELFCFEGNYIKDYKSILSNEGNSIDTNYYASKNWFSFICYYDSGKFIFYDNLDESNKRKYTILNIKRKLDNKYYDYRSLEKLNEHYIMVPRRIGCFKDIALENKVRTLDVLLRNPKREIYKDDVYKIKVEYNDTIIFDFINKNELEDYKVNIIKSKKNYLLYSFICYLYYELGEGDEGAVKENEDIQNKKEQIKSLFKNRVFNIEKYLVLTKSILQILTNNVDEYIEESMKVIKQLAELPEEYNGHFKKGFISYTLNSNETENNLKVSKNEIERFYKIISLSYDAKHEYGHTYNNFFNDCSISSLSDGEAVNLDTYSTIYEQLGYIEAEDIVLLLDEPDAHFHPELSRNFVNDLIKFLGSLYKNKTFQIIITTHSPFILSDVVPGNIIYIKRDGVKSIVERKNVKTFAGNIHSLLIRDFYMDSTIGEFAKNEIQKIIGMVKDNTISKYDEKKLNYIINSIAEPVIKRKLEKVVSETNVLDDKASPVKKIRSDEVNETIDLLETQIEQLKGHIRQLRGGYL